MLIYSQRYYKLQEFLDEVVVQKATVSQRHHGVSSRTMTVSGKRLRARKRKCYICTSKLL